MKRIIISLLLLSSITSVYASGFQWSRLYHNRLNTFVRSTKLPLWQYVIGVYSSGNTITEYTEPDTIIQKIEVIKEVPIEKEVIRYINVERQVSVPLPKGSYLLLKEDIDKMYGCAYYATTQEFQTCVFNYLRYTIPVIPFQI